MRPTLLLPSLLALATTSLSAQGPTHLGVPVNSLVEVQFIRDTTSGFTQLYKFHSYVRADGQGTSFAIPAGKVLVLRDIEVRFGCAARTAPTTLLVVHSRAKLSGTGSFSSYGQNHMTYLRLGASTVITDEMSRLDLPAGMAFTGTYIPVVYFLGPASLVSGVNVGAWGYLVDDPGAMREAPAPAAPLVLESPAGQGAFQKH